MLNPASSDFSITLETAHVLAAAELASKKDVRFYLNGICVDGFGPQVLVVGTNGTCLGIIRTGVAAAEKFAFIVPNMQIDILKKSGGAGVVFTYAGERHDGQGQWKMESLGVSSTWTTEGCYPDFRRIVPEKTSGEAAQYAPELIQKFLKARKALNLSDKKTVKMTTAHNGSSAALVSFPECAIFTGVIMPLRVTDADIMMQSPAWARVRRA